MDICQLWTQAHDTSDKTCVKGCTNCSSFISAAGQTPLQKKAAYELKECMRLTVLGCSPSFQRGQG